MIYFTVKKYSLERKVIRSLSNKNKKLIYLIFGIVLSVMIVVTGILFAVSCYSIYTRDIAAGENIYSREIVAEYFARIAVPVYITVALIAIGAVMVLVLEAITPEEREKLAGTRTASEICSKLASKVDISKADEEVRTNIEKERKLRRVLMIVNIVMCAVLCTISLVYILNPMHFSTEKDMINISVLRSAIVCICCILPIIIYEIVHFYIRNTSFKRETEILKNVLKLGIKAEDVSTGEDGFVGKICAFFKKNDKPITLGVRIALIGCAVVFITLGVLNGGMEDVLSKAVAICSECIGLG